MTRRWCYTAAPDQSLSAAGDSEFAVLNLEGRTVPWDSSPMMKPLQPEPPLVATAVAAAATATMVEIALTKPKPAAVAFATLLQFPAYSA